MKYNTELGNLILPEYGRNVQKLVEHAKTIEDSEYRQAFIEKVVKLMEQMNPQTKNIEDNKKKIWGHVLQISGYDLDIKTPDNVIDTPEERNKKPAKIPYPGIKSRFRHYGKNVQNMIQKAIEMEDAEKKAAFSEIIGAYMKMAYKTWNREEVSNEQILLDLKNLSGGELTLSADANLDSLVAPNKKRKRNTKTHSGHKKGGRKDYKRRKY